LIINNNNTKHKCPVTHGLEIAITTAIVLSGTITLAIDDITKTIAYAAKKSRPKSMMTMMKMLNEKNTGAVGMSFLQRDVVNHEVMRQLKLRKKKTMMTKMR
jgi:hypothetical protein